MTMLLLFLIVWPLGAAETSFKATWKKAMRPDVDGTLSIRDGGITFQPNKKGKQTLEWSFEDVQHLDRLSPTEFALQSYTDSVMRIGRDRRYRFALLDGMLSDELHAQVVARIGKPATDRVSREPTDAELAIPAKQVRFMKGTQGTIYLTPEWIIYSTEAKGASRAWRLDRDVETVWSSDPYRLEVHVLEGSEAFVRRAEVYRFALKRPLDPAQLSRLRMKLYSLRSGR